MSSSSLCSVQRGNSGNKISAVNDKRVTTAPCWNQIPNGYFNVTKGAHQFTMLILDSHDLDRGSQSGRTEGSIAEVNFSQTDTGDDSTIRGRS